MKIRIFLLSAIFIFISTQGFAWSGAEKLYNKADRSYLQADYENALERCQRLLKEFKTSGFKDDANFLAGLSLLKLNRYAEAREHFGKVIDQKPVSSLKEDAYLGLADSYFLEKNYSKASELYHEILSYFPKTNLSGIIDSRLKNIEEKQGKPSKAPSLYTIQIGSFKKKSNARRLYRKFKKKGYSAYIFESKEGGRSFYRVRIGKFKSRKGAEAFAKKLKKQGYETKICAW